MASLYELFVKLTADTKEFKGPLKDAQAQMGSFGTGAAKLAAQLGTGIGLAAIGAAATSAAHKFDTAFAQIARSTGATGEQLEALNKSFVEVYKSTSASAESVTIALSNISTRTGATGKALEQLTLQMIKLAKTQKEDVGALTPLVTRVFGDWSIATNDQAGALKYLQAVSQQTGTSVAKLSETVVYAGAPLRMLGYDFERAAMLIGKFEKEGVNTELVLGGMKAALQKFAKEGVKDVQAEWEKFVKGVKDGSITLTDALKLVGAKRGPDLYRAIVEGRFEIDKMTSSAKELAEKGGGSIETFTGQLTKLQHQLEAVVANHKDLVMVAPMVVMAIGTVATGITALIPLLAKAASGTAVVFSAGVIASIWATSEAIDALFRKYDALGKKGKELIVPWNAEEGKAVSSGLGFRMVKPTAPPAPDPKAIEEYARALEKALGLFDLSDKKAKELHESLGILHQEFAAGRLSAEQYGSALAKYWQSMAEPAEKAAAEIEKLNQEMGDSWSTALRQRVDQFVMFERAHEEFAARTREQVQITADSFLLLPEAIRYALLNAAEAVMDAKRGILGNLSTEIGLAQLDTIQAKAAGDKGVKELAEKYGKVSAVAQTAMGDVERATRRAFDGMARGMAKSIVEWKGFGETMKSVAKDFAEGMLEAVIRGFLKPLEDLVARTVAKISGKLFDALGVGGGAATSGVSSGVGGVASAGGGGAASAAAGGAMGWVGAIGSAVTAVSGVISNFQMAGMNKSLDLIEHETRFSQIHLLNILEKLNTYLPGVKDIWSYGWTAQYPLLLKMTSALELAKGGSVTINVNGAGDPRAVAQEVARALRLQVPAAAWS